VAVTAYNHADWVAWALDGVLAQETDVPYDVVIGEDCSDDGTRDIVREFQRRHPRTIRLVLPDRNLGCRGNAIFLEVLRHARGEYIATLDGDDAWLSPRKLSTQVAFLDANPACAMCFHDAVVELPDGSRAATRYTPDWVGTTVALEELWRENPIASATPLFRASALARLPAWYRDSIFGDWPLYLLAAMQGRIAYLPEPMALYRAHARGLWSGLSRTRQVLHVIEFLEAMRRSVGREHRGGLRASLARHRLELASIHADAGRGRLALRALVGAFLASPAHPGLRDAAARRTARAILLRTRS
jgi:glycosyltransferase involved in cell wall biosynthesis